MSSIAEKTNSLIFFKNLLFIIKFKYRSVFLAYNF